MSAPNTLSDVMRAWTRHGARDAAHVLMLEANGDAAEAHRILAGLDLLDHVRAGIGTYLPWVAR